VYSPVPPPIKQLSPSGGACVEMSMSLTGSGRRIQYEITVVGDIHEGLVDSFCQRMEEWPNQFVGYPRSIDLRNVDWEFDYTELETQYSPGGVVKTRVVLERARWSKKII
jgi:hypothetical protein